MSRVWLVYVSDVFVQCLCSVMCLCSVGCVCGVSNVNHDYSARLTPVHKARRTYHWVVANVSMSHVPHMHKWSVTRTRHRHTWRMHTCDVTRWRKRVTSSCAPLNDKKRKRERVQWGSRVSERDRESQRETESKRERELSVNERG